MRGLIKKSFVLAIVAVLAFSAFGLSVQPASAATSPTRLALKVASGTGTAAVVDINGKVKVSVSSVYPSTASKSVTWSIYSGKSYGKLTNIASSYCYVQGIKTGTVTVKAKSKYYPYVTKYINVYVKQLYPSAVTMSPTSQKLWVGATAQNTATVTKKSWVYNSGVTWKSSNIAVATVSTTGKITAKAAGPATITVTSKDKSTLKATCAVEVYSAALTSTSRKTLAVDGTYSNALNITGPPEQITIAYTSTNTAVATIDATGKVTAIASGGTTIKATATIVATGKKVTTSYIVDVKRIEGAAGESFDFSPTYSKLGITHETLGFTGARELLLTPDMLDDFFGFGVLGVDLFNPMDVSENFMSSSFNWDAGGFVFAKTGTLVEISTFKNGVPFFNPYSVAAKDSLTMVGDNDTYTGYTLRFDYYPDPADGSATITLDQNVLTIPFAGQTLELTRVAYNKVEIRDADYGTDPVLTITRTPGNYHFDINDPQYKTDKGITFGIYESYL